MQYCSYCHKLVLVPCTNKDTPEVERETCIPARKMPAKVLDVHEEPLSRDFELAAA